MTQQELERLIDEIQASLAGRGRWLVPHGFTVEAVQDDTALLRMPASWRPQRGRALATASTVPYEDDVTELRCLFEEGLASGQFMLDSTLTEWSPVIEDGPRPSNLNWNIRVRVSG